jgi:hypothetical protein
VADNDSDDELLEKLAATNTVAVAPSARSVAETPEEEVYKIALSFKQYCQEQDKTTRK